MQRSDHPKWGILISSIDNLVRDLAERNASPDFDLWCTAPGHVSTDYIWASAHFDDTANHYELADRATALKAVFDGAMYVEYGGYYRPPPLRGLIEIKTERRHDLPAGNVLVSPFSPVTIEEAMPRWRNPTAHFGVEQMIFLARYDPIALAMLKHLGFNGPDFRTLYALLDWLRANGWKKEEKIAAPSGMAVNRVDQFKLTVNNVDVLGPFARHGPKGWAPPKAPVSLPEAQRLILSAARAFLQERAAAWDVKAKWGLLEDPHDLF